MKNKGFTLMELMIVIAIIMILAGAIVARVSTTGERAKVAKAKAECEEIASACRAFNLDTGLWPIDFDGLIKSATTKGNNEEYVSTDITSIPGASWEGPYLETEKEEVPLDPWGQPYQLKYDNGPPHKLYVRAGTAHEDDVYRLVHLLNS